MPKERTVPCRVCGGLMWASPTSLPPGVATCRPCRALLRAERVPLESEPKEARQCEACRELYEPTRSDQRCCSSACRKAANNATRGDRHRHPSRLCEVCNLPYVPTYSKQRTCSRSCGLAIHRHKPAVVKPYRPRECQICGRFSRPGDKWVKFCSTQCRIDNTGHRVKDLYGAALELGLHGGPWLSLLTQYLCERDGDRCAICRRAIRFDLKSGPKGHPSGRGPSIDHIVPRSVEVNDDPANLRLTHWRCNFERKAGRSGEVVQLALVG